MFLRRGMMSLRIILFLLLLLLLSTILPWLLIPIAAYIAYKVGRWLYKLVKSLKWPKAGGKRKERVSSVSTVGDIQVYEVEGIGQALVVKNGLEALGLGCLEVRSLGGGRLAELLSAIDATVKTGFESSLIVSKRTSGDACFMIMIKVRKPMIKDFLETAKEVVDDVVKGLTAAMGAIKARLPRSEVHVLEFDDLLKAIRGVVA
ncbi:MAG: hypothetical protein QXD66_04370 [Candidatus Nezhaarchaeales archaeon]|nr:MAG: hypothetical protein DSO05_02145 [Candidatus Nezhaarchaeota archaeon WYZ-LMO7]